MRPTLVRMAGLAALLVSVCTASAQQFPNKVVEIIVSFPPGGSVDLGSRVVAGALEQKWKSPVRVVNKAGGNNLPAIDEMMRSAPDGHRVFMDLMSTSSLVTIMRPDFQHKVMDRTFITLALQTPMVLAVNASGPFQTMKDLVEGVRKDPRSITWTSLGGTGVVDLGARRFFKAIGVDVNLTRPVSFRGSAESVVQVAGGQVMIGVGTPAAFAPMIQAGKIKVLAVFAPKRSPLAPEIPTAAELGYPDSDAIQWNGLSGPPGMSPEIIALWHKTVQELIADPAVIAKLATIGMEPNAGDGAAMKKIVADETELLRGLFPQR